MMFSLPKQVVLDLDGTPVAGAFVYFYRAGTTTPQTVYDGNAVALPNPVQADGFGVLPAIFLDQRGADYKAVVTRQDGTTLYTQDNIPARQRPSQAGTATFPNATSVQVTFSPVEPDTNYRVVLGPQASGTFWVSNKTTSGFTLRAAANSTALVDWVVLR